MAKVGMISLGCPKNLVDTEFMLGSLVNSDHEIALDEEDADILIINTCGFLESAKKEALDEVKYALNLRDFGDCKGVIVTGCLPQRLQKLSYPLNTVDAVLGIDAAKSIVEVIDQVMEGKTVHDVPATPNVWVEHTARMVTTPPGTAYVKVSEGCSNRCAYCTIPDIRGEFRSRPEEMVVEDVRRLADLGIKEIILIGQDTTQYGKDFGVKDALAKLLEKLAALPGLCWIRLMYCYPTKVSDSLISAMADLDKVVKYMDIPVQHGDDSILKAMNRQGSADEYLQLIETMRSKMPDIALRTTFIVGFPGETDKQFEKLMNFAAQAKFDRAGAFIYSKERGTPAARAENQVPKRVKVQRMESLMELLKEISFEKNKTMVGKKLDVLVENQNDGGVVGRSYRDAPDIDGKVFVSDLKNDPGEIIKVKIKGYGDYDLFA